VNDLGLVEAVDRFGERIVVGITDAADRRLDAGLGARRSVYLIDTYWLPRSLWWIRPPP
jgi:hypothetical protein